MPKNNHAMYQVKLANIYNDQIESHKKHWAAFHDDPLQEKFKIKINNLNNNQNNQESGNNNYSIKIHKKHLNEDNLPEENNNIKLNLFNSKNDEDPISNKPIKIALNEANQTKEPLITIKARFDPLFKPGRQEWIPNESFRVKINGTTFRGYEGTPFQFTFKNKSNSNQVVTWNLENVPSGPGKREDGIRNLTNRKGYVVRYCNKNWGCNDNDIYKWIDTNTTGTIKLKPNKSKSLTKLFEVDTFGQGEITYPISFYANGNELISSWRLIVTDEGMFSYPGAIRISASSGMSLSSPDNEGRDWTPLNKNKLNINEGDNTTIGLSFDDTTNSKLPEKIFWSVGDASSGLDQNDFSGKSNFLKPNKTNSILKDKSNNTFPVNFNIPSDNSKEKKESLTINFWADKKRTQPLGDPLKIIIKDVKGTIPKPDTPKPDTGINPNTPSQPSFSVDLPPVVVDRSKSIEEDIKPGTTITDLADANSGEDTDNAGNPLTYTIKTGNDDGLFFIDPDSGVISIAAGKSLNYDTKRSHKLTVEASDGSQSGSAVITIEVTDVSGYPAPADTSPSLEDQTVQVNESIKPGDEIVDLSDESGGDTNGNGDALTYAISSGNDHKLFKINPSNGKISLSDEKVPTAKFLDYETQNSFTLGISARADGKTDTAEITLEVQNQTEQFSLGTPAEYSWGGDDITGTISNSYSNWISLPINKGQSVSLGFNGSGTLDSQNNVYVKAVYNDFGHLVDENTYFKEFGLTSYDIIAPYTGTYYVEVKASNGETGSYAFGATDNGPALG